MVIDDSARSWKKMEEIVSLELRAPFYVIVTCARIHIQKLFK